MKLHVNKAVLKTLMGTVLAVTTLFSGCKKDEIIVPKTEIFYPYAHQTFSFGDTIFVSGAIQHPNATSATVALVNSDFKVVESPIKISTKPGKFTFETYLIIENSKIESGKHHIRVQVFAQGQTFNQFVEVNINGLPLQLHAMVVATSKNASRQLLSVTNFTNSNEVFSESGDVSGIGVNSDARTILTMPKTVGKAQVFSLNTNQQIWNSTIPGSGTTVPVVFAVRRFNNIFYTCYANGQIKAQNGFGNSVQTYNLPANFAAVDVLVQNNFVLAVGKHVSNGTHTVFYFQQSTGAILRQIALLQSKNHVAICPYLNTGFLVVYNKQNQQAGWQQFLFDGTEIFMPAIDNFTATSALSINNVDFVLGTTNGVYAYQQNFQQFNKLLSASAELLVFEPLTSTLVIANNTVLSSFMYPDMSSLGFCGFANEIVAVDFLYNK